MRFAHGDLGFIPKERIVLMRWELEGEAGRRFAPKGKADGN